ncbi:hypothetical protein ET495_00385 [Xylanimonas allomyrinae]|uniref:Transporter n=1 Tax=Xylanimonas allomyrinae TaxID=2509459 RepID=A0A4P6EVE0_9MICO|nr:hypothetical protein [Xylanimonas allomyrinae]QAY62008.1 hypothetical protein ET495_00385 [Xylanimonas allomyrinae]
MVAQFVRLKLTLMANTFRRSVWQTIGVVLGSLYAAGVLVVAVGGAIAGGTSDAVVTGQVLIVVGAVLVLGWWLVPVFLYGVDATLDPHRFATYAIPRTRLLAGLAVAGVVSIPGIATLLATVGAAFAWWRTPTAVLAALVGAVLAVALCVVGSRAVTTALSPLLESRRSREVLTIITIVPLMLFGPAFSWFAQRTESAAEAGADAVPQALADISALVSWTPFGAPWGLAAAVHDGAWVAALGRLAVAVATLAVAVWVWDRALTRTLERPVEGGGKGARGKGLGLFDRFPATPVGAVAARAAIYWVRDPRYSTSILLIPLLPVVLFFATRSGGSEVIVILAPLAAWIAGFAISNDIGYDHTAFALHVATGIRGSVDRWGRAVPVLVVGMPLVVAYALVAAALSGRWEWLPPLLGLSVGTLAASTGVSSLVSARWLYPVPRPGESPFKQPQGAAGATMVAQAASTGLVGLVSLPGVALTLLAILLPSPVLGWVALVVAPVVGIVTLVVGVRWGSRIYDLRAPELLQRVLSYA